MLSEGRGGAALTFCGNQMTVGAFVVLAASSPTPKRRVCLRLEGCLIPLGSPLSFWNELAVRGVVDPGRHAPAAYPFERLI